MNVREDVIDLLREAVEGVRRLRARNHFAPDAGQFVMELLEYPVATAYSSAARQLGAAEDNALALGLVLAHREMSIAPCVLARASIEASGRAWNLLDPELTARDRLGFAISERLNDLHELERLMISHDPFGDGETRDRDLASVRSHIIKLRNAARAKGVVVPRRPSFSHTVRSVLAFSATDDEFGRVVAATYSAFAHATPELLLARTVSPIYPSGHDFMVGLTELEDSAVDELVLAVLLAYSRAATRQAETYGWPLSSLKRSAAHARAVLRRALRAETNTGRE
jgi:hypothetical protein